MSEFLDMAKRLGWPPGSVTIRRERPPGDYRALIRRKNEQPFDARIVEIIYYERRAGDRVMEFIAEGAVFDNDGRLVPLSQVEGVVAILDPGEQIADVLQPKKQARRRRLLRAGKYALAIVGAARTIA